MKLIDIANQYRAANPRLSGGYVVIFEGEVTGWTDSLARPESWMPGCIAVSEIGKCYEAQGGNDYDGASQWKLSAATLANIGGAA